MIKIRARKFSGRCSRHKRYNPAIDGPEAADRACRRCTLLAEIYVTSLKLNKMIRQFNPAHDDTQHRGAELVDDSQMSLLDGLG